MFGTKIILGSAALASIIAALTLIWFDTRFVFGVTASKLYASLFVLLAVTMTKECCSINTQDYEHEV